MQSASGGTTNGNQQQQQQQQQTSQSAAKGQEREGLNRSASQPLNSTNCSSAGEMDAALRRAQSFESDER